MEHPGDRDAAFRQIYERHYPRVVRFFWRLGVTSGDAAEFAQETFIHFYRNMDKYRGDAEWAYLQKIARNILVNAWRDQHAQKRNGVVVDLDGPESAELQDVLIAEGDPHTELTNQELERMRIQKLSAAIEGLPLGARQVIRLQLAGLTYMEIAETLRLTTDAVKSRVRDAKRLLRASLKTDDESGSPPAKRG
jgi:RNA polymerase sigma-70 factor, ECF subfamily